MHLNTTGGQPSSVIPGHHEVLQTTTPGHEPCKYTAYCQGGRMLQG